MLLVTQGTVTYRGLAAVSSAEHAEPVELDPSNPANNTWGWTNPRHEFMLTATELTPALARSYIILPKVVLQARRTLALILLQGFEHAADRNDYEIACGGDGPTLLQLLYAQRPPPSACRSATTSSTRCRTRS